jgi:hypothetical protein
MRWCAQIIAPEVITCAAAPGGAAGVASGSYAVPQGGQQPQFESSEVLGKRRGSSIDLLRRREHPVCFPRFTRGHGGELGAQVVDIPASSRMAMVDWSNHRIPLADADPKVTRAYWNLLTAVTAARGAVG